MKALVVYDSKFGNTERLARVIAEELGGEVPAPMVTATAAGERDDAQDQAHQPAQQGQREQDE